MLNSLDRTSETLRIKHDRKEYDVRNVVVVAEWKTVQKWEKDRLASSLKPGRLGLHFGYVVGQTCSNSVLTDTSVSTVLDRILEMDAGLRKHVIPKVEEVNEGRKLGSVWYFDKPKTLKGGETGVYGVFRHSPDVGAAGVEGSYGFERGYVDVRGEDGERCRVRVGNLARCGNGDWVRLEFRVVEEKGKGDDGDEGEEEEQEEVGGIRSLDTARSSKGVDGLLEGVVADVREVLKPRGFTNEGIVGHVLFEGMGGTGEDEKVRRENENVNVAVFKAADESRGYALVRRDEGLKGLRVVATVEKWSRKTRLPTGRVKSVIGKVGEVRFWMRRGRTKELRRSSRLKQRITQQRN